MQIDLKNMLLDDFAFLLDEVGDTATVNGQASVPVIETTRTTGSTGDDFGQMPTANVSLLVLRTRLMNAPAVGDLVVFKTVTYRIESITTYQFDDLLILNLQDDHE